MNTSTSKLVVILVIATIHICQSNDPVYIASSKATTVRDTLSKADQTISNKMKSCFQKWNRNSEVIVSGYMDPEKKPNLWVAKAKSNLDSLRHTYVEINALSIEITNASLRGRLKSLSGIYKEKLDCISYLVPVDFSPISIGIQNFKAIDRL